MKLPIPKIYIERRNGTFRVTVSTALKSNCCDTEIFNPDKNGYGFCGDCGDYARGWRPTKIRLIKQ